MMFRKIISFIISLCLSFSLLFPALPVLASDKDVDTVYLGVPSYVRWETNTTGTWGSVKKASMYQVKLFISDYVDRDEDNWKYVDMDDEDMECVVSLKTSDRTIDFSEYMVDGHDYFFVVRAIPKTNQQAYYVAGDWVASKDSNTATKSTIGTTGGIWRNYLEGSKYETENGSYLSDGWQLISGNWYYLANGGYRQNGFLQNDGKIYYLNEYGQLIYGWIELGDDWYFSNEYGVISIGWAQAEPGKYYYFDSTGKMLHDCYIDNYWLDSSGLAHEEQSSETDGVSSSGNVIIAGSQNA